MKHLFTYILLIFISASCVEEEDVFETPFVETKLETISENVPSFLLNTTSCFEFIFPLTLNSNQNESIVISNNTNLVSLLNRQSINFFITEIQLPFSVTNFDNELIEVNTIANYSQLSNQCNVPLLKDRVQEELIRNFCLNYDYPIVIFNSSEDKISIEDRTSFINYLSDQDPDFELKFEYPVLIEEIFGLQTLINNEFRMHGFLRSCLLGTSDPIVIDNACIDLPELIVTQTNNEGLFNFTVSAGNERLSNISWFIDNQNVNTNTTTILNRLFNNDGLQEIKVSVNIGECQSLFVTSIIVDTNISSVNLNSNCNILTFENMTTAENITNEMLYFRVPDNLIDSFSDYRWEINGVELTNEIDPFLTLDINGNELVNIINTFSLTLKAESDTCPITEVHSILVDK